MRSTTPDGYTRRSATCVLQGGSAGRMYGSTNRSKLFAFAVKWRQYSPARRRQRRSRSDGNSGAAATVIETRSMRGTANKPVTAQNGRTTMNRTKLSRRYFLAGTSALVSAAALGSFPDIARADEHKTVRARMDTDIGSLDPNSITGGAEGDVLETTLPGLVEFDIKEDGKIGWKPSPFVSSIDASDDGMKIAFTLKPGFQWSGGNGELTAEDVKYTLE